ncbi:MAG: biotin--[acetyl-CoA-carboxylase] ligase [Candidatus Hydrogenedentota bacterium]|nr:MAG: biotin--[acetyl-CoA-carboxylase] ligase [Candidatus Hydrogenedentota bacterium]
MSCVGEPAFLLDFPFPEKETLSCFFPFFLRDFSVFSVFSVVSPYATCGSPVKYWIRHLRAVDSTQNHLRRLLDRGATPPHGMVILTDKQTRGRGRHNRRWLSPPGGLYFSLLLYANRAGAPGPSEALSPEILPLLPLAIGAAAAEALDPRGESILIKWPNDLAARNRKLGGILVESDTRAAIAGVGINIEPVPLSSAISLAELFPGRTFEKRILLSKILDRFSHFLEEGPGAVTQSVNKRLYGRGVEAVHEGKTGFVREVLPNGALRLEGKNGDSCDIISGEIFPRDWKGGNLPEEAECGPREALDVERSIETVEEKGAERR